MNTTPKYSQLKAMLAISKASFRSMLRSPSAVIFGLLFPLVFILAFGFIKPGNIKLDVALDNSSDTTGNLYRELKNTPVLQFKERMTNDAQTDLLQKGRLDAIIYVDRTDTGSMIENIRVITSKASREKSKIVVSVVGDAVNRQNMLRLRELSQSMPEAMKQLESSNQPMAELTTGEIPGREYKTIDFILPGQLGFSILSAGVFGTAFVFFSLRQTLVLKRFFATPINRSYIILGEALSRLVFQLCGSALIIALGRFFFGFTLINGWMTAATMLLLAAIGLIVFMGFGFVVSGIAKNESTIPPIANIITLPQFLLSGTFFSVDVFPNWLQAISKVLPLTYLNDALRKVAFEGAGLSELLPQLGVIGLWGIVVYFLAVRFFRWE
jgi:ABC-2 type transport system permease protein